MQDSPTSLSSTPLVTPASVMLALGQLAYCPSPYATSMNLRQSWTGFHAVLTAALANGFNFGQAADLIEALSAGSTKRARELCEQAIKAAGPEAFQKALLQMQKIDFM